MSYFGQAQGSCAEALHRCDVFIEALKLALLPHAGVRSSSKMLLQMLQGPMQSTEYVPSCLEPSHHNVAPLYKSKGIFPLTALFPVEDFLEGCCRNKLQVEHKEMGSLAGHTQTLYHWEAADPIAVFMCKEMEQTFKTGNTHRWAKGSHRCNTDQNPQLMQLL